MNKHLDIKAKGRPDYTSLYDHLLYVSKAAVVFARYLGLDENIARFGGILHDIGKVSDVFQERLKPDFVMESNNTPYRHEISSLFFISLFPKEIHPQLIEMVLSHHKSIIRDKRQKGLIDLIDDYGHDNIFDMHTNNFDIWSIKAIEILGCFGIKTHVIGIEEARENFLMVCDYVANNIIPYNGYSEWKGLLMGADHFASAVSHKTEDLLNNTFKKPNLDYYSSRESKLYPLSMKRSDSPKPHTIVTAGTGSGKTDYLFRRCKGRVFYTLPYTASINAMYKRIKLDTEKDNNDLDVRVLHSSSRITIKDSGSEIKLIQNKFGASIKVLTPHQLAGIVFGVSGYESILLDLRGCDVVLDEIHTYSDKMQGIVLKIVEMLKYNGCRVHIGTATLPTVLYNRILDILGRENVCIVSLTKNEMKTYDRHKIFKHNTTQLDKVIINKIKKSIKNDEKILIVRNRVNNAQETYHNLKKEFPDVPIMLLHSRFKRGDRNRLENKLFGLDDNGVSINQFNTSDKACIVVSTQVVEVSVDISFDFMITDVAPVDALIQRFGRINRKRNHDTIGRYKPIIVLSPPEKNIDALPYSLNVLQRTYDALPHRKILRESNIKKLIDSVYPTIEMINIDEASIFTDSFNKLVRLEHTSKSTLFEELDILGVSVVLDSDVNLYINSRFEDRMMLEIPVMFHSISRLNLAQIHDTPNKPFIVNSDAYNDETGLDINILKIINNNNLI